VHADVRALRQKQHSPFAGCFSTLPSRQIWATRAVTRACIHFSSCVAVPQAIAYLSGCNAQTYLGPQTAAAVLLSTLNP
jgi:hypothetical protein